MRSSLASLPVSTHAPSRAARALGWVAILAPLALAGCSSAPGDGAAGDVATAAQAVTAAPRARGIGALAAMHDRTCAVRADGSVSCWGHYLSGPTTMSGLAGVTALSNGRFFACALRGDGTVACFGKNDHGQLGDGTLTDSYAAPVAVQSIDEVSAVSSGEYHSCALRVDGTIRCWGDNSYGQLGDGTTTASGVPVTVAGITGATAVLAAGVHSCAVLADGTLRCWGRNGSGELGDGTFVNRPLPTPVPGLSSVAGLGGGAWHTCALLADGTVSCWGYNFTGELGRSTSGNLDPNPAPVPGLGGVVALAQGAVAQNTCAILGDGTLRCFGDNTWGELGDGTTTPSTSPVAPSGLGAVTAISTSGYHTCALLPDGTVRCWGLNQWGELGDGTLNDSPTPVAVAGLSGEASRAILAAGAHHACTLSEGEGKVYCWGDNSRGQLGNGTSGTSPSAPVTVSNLSGALAVAAGAQHTCALLAGGAVRCWGDNYYGQLGDGTTVESDAPAVPALASGATAIAAGGHTTCALMANGTVRCWGFNKNGQLGDGTHWDRAQPVTVVDPTGTPLTGATAVAVGESHACVLLADGSARCWGYNFYGQLGNGGASDSSTPVVVDPDHVGADRLRFSAIAAGSNHTCAVDTAGHPFCWGNNYHGQIGVGSINPPLSVTTPVQVITGSAPLDGQIAIRAGVFHTCSQAANGAVSCWGDNYLAQLAVEASAPRPYAAQVGTSAFVLAAGAGFNCARTAIGVTSCWGDDQFGQLGSMLPSGHTYTPTFMQVLLAP